MEVGAFDNLGAVQPDFVVETTTGKLIVEIKAKKDLKDETVLAKAKAARVWIGHANTHAKSYGGKPWRYLLVPHDALLESMSLAGLAARYELQSIIEKEDEVTSVLC